MKLETKDASTPRPNSKPVSASFNKRGTTNIQRLVLMLLALGLVFAMIINFNDWNNGGTGTVVEVTHSDMAYENMEAYLDQMAESNLDTSQLVTDPTYGDSEVAGSYIGQILGEDNMQAIHTMKTLGESGEDDWEEYLVKYLGEFLVYIVTTLLILESFFIVFNKKNT